MTATNIVGSEDLDPGRTVSSLNGYSASARSNLALVATHTYGTNNDPPSMSVTQSFVVTVLRPAQPESLISSLGGGCLQFTVSGDSGPDYILETATDPAPVVMWTLELLFDLFEETLDELCRKGSAYKDAPVT